MNQEELISWIEHIEKTIPVHELRFRRRAVWPLLRLLLISDLSNQSLRCQNNSKKLSVSRILSSRRQTDSMVEFFSRTSLIFLDQSSKYANYQGQPYHRFFDPVRDNIRESVDFCRLFWNDNPSAIEVSLSGALDVRQLYALADNDLCRIWKTERSLSLKIEALLKEWEVYTGIYVSRGIVLERLLTYSRLVDLLRKTVKKRKLTVFVTCFYSIPAFALTTAVQEEGGTAIELQHGQQGATHPMYTHWFNRSGETYHMIPKVFWMWNHRGVERMAEWVKPFGIRAIEGGNPWLGLFEDSKEERTSTGRRTIVYSMQFSELPDFVWQAIPQMQNFHWVLRMHPRFLSEHDNFEAECLVKLKGVNNWEIQTADIDFYDAIRDADLHLTGWSTTAFEALHFGVSTILVHPNGRTSMAREISEGVFRYAGNLAELRDSISHVSANRSKQGASNFTLQDPVKVFTNLVQELKQ